MSFELKCLPVTFLPLQEVMSRHSDVGHPHTCTQSQHASTNCHRCLPFPPAGPCLAALTARPEEGPPFLMAGEVPPALRAPWGPPWARICTSIPDSMGRGTCAVAALAAGLMGRRTGAGGGAAGATRTGTEVCVRGRELEA